MRSTHDDYKLLLLECSDETNFYRYKKLNKILALLLISNKFFPTPRISIKTEVAGSQYS